MTEQAVAVGEGGLRATQPEGGAKRRAAQPQAAPRRADQLERKGAGRQGDLVVVESPTKARTLERMLGSGYKVEASYGHVRDLPKSRIGIDLETFEPEYEVPADSEKHVRQLRRDAKGAERIWLATDLDREGEAIAWHVADLIGAPASKLRRVTFHEITPAAIRESFRKPRQIDVDLVDAQQARRVVDRLVGYKLSPLLWKVIRYGLSAGRVQSVALRLIVDREREIQAFTSEEYWSLDAILASRSGETFTAEVIQHHGHKLHIKDAAAADRHRAALADAVYRVLKVESRETSRTAPPSFTTSTLQQEASRRLGFPLKRTMALAQQLYEGIALGNEGEVGLITYMRTDSVHVAEGALRQARDVVAREFGTEYALEKPRHYKTRSRGAQEAHEAIRPTDVSRAPARIRRYLRPDQLKLYTLIWQRTIASQMAPARFEGTRLDIEADGHGAPVHGVPPQVAPGPEGDTSAGDGKAHREAGHRAAYLLRANGRTLLFDGYLRAYQEGSGPGRARSGSAATSESYQAERVAAPSGAPAPGRSGRELEPGEPERQLAPLPEVAPGDELKLLGLEAGQHFTQAPPRFTEASLVKTLEDHGIGRPSTYAPTISTLIDRRYVRRDQRALVPEDVALTVIDFLRDHFADIVDLGFTARMEEDLDRIATGQAQWVPIVREFFTPFAARVAEKTATVKKSDVTEEPTDKTCPKCGRPLVIKLGRYGRFYSCTGFVKGKKGQPLPSGACDYSAPLEGQEQPAAEIVEGEVCPECGKPLARKRGRYGPFIGCTGYPECKYIKRLQAKTGVTCPKCGKGELVRRRGRGRSSFFGCERYPDCEFTARQLPETPVEAVAVGSDPDGGGRGALRATGARAPAPATNSSPEPVGSADRG